MRFDKFIPKPRLKPYIKYFVVSENELENEYKVFPSAGLVIGFQYKGQLAAIKENTESRLAPAGIQEFQTGIKSLKTLPALERYWFTLPKLALHILLRILPTNCLI